MSPPLSFVRAIKYNVIKAVFILGLLNEKHSSYNEFINMRKETNDVLEYVDGVVYMSPSPNIKHQRISTFLQGELYNALKDKKCEVFSAPTDVLFDAVNHDDKKIVVPDLFVTCNPDNLTENEHIGAPDFIIEILSPSNISHDIVTKLNLYMKNNVKEYWIIDPLQRHILVYNRDKNNEIRYDVLHVEESIRSKTVPSLELNLSDIFQL